ncbi:MAG: hypothetical protein IPJ98_28360 [Bryobacterales bacterium]|nr:hypothetical protein [Bryobacterales bacterium]
MARRVFGAPERVELPAPGTKLTVNGPAWRMMRNGASVRFALRLRWMAKSSRRSAWRTVAAEGEAGSGPLGIASSAEGVEVQAWVNAETERLKIATSMPTGAVALADGGVLVGTCTRRFPDAPWDEVSRQCS